MAIARVLFLLLLLTAGGAFGYYIFTGERKYRRFGLIVLGWTLLAAFSFFAVLIVERLM